MTDWKALSHAYGEASEIPALIERLRETPDEKTWQDLWSCLCHQGTVYPASFAALQPLRDLARALPRSDRLSPLMLIAGIIASHDLSGLTHRPVDLIEPLISDLQALVEESMTMPGLDAEKYLYHLETAAAFVGDLFWGRELDHLVDGEFPGQCPACGHELYLVIGDCGFFVTAQDWVRPENASVTRNPIVPADHEDLPITGAWLYSKAISHEQTEVASWIKHVFGTSACPACRNSISVVDAIVLAAPQSSRPDADAPREQP